MPVDPVDPVALSGRRHQAVLELRRGRPGLAGQGVVRHRVDGPAERGADARRDDVDPHRRLRRPLPLPRRRHGSPVMPDLVTGDLAKGSATSDPDGYPLYYAGSRDNHFRVVAMDRAEPTVLWTDRRARPVARAAADVERRLGRCRARDRRRARRGRRERVAVHRAAQPRLRLAGAGHGRSRGGRAWCRASTTSCSRRSSSRGAPTPTGSTRATTSRSRARWRFGTASSTWRTPAGSSPGGTSPTCSTAGRACIACFGS